MTREVFTANERLALAISITVAIHVAAMITLDIIDVVTKLRPIEEPAHVELVEVEVAKPPPPAPPPPEQPSPPTPEPAREPPPRTQTRAAPAAAARIQPPTAPPVPTNEPPGGAPLPVARIDESGPAGKIPVAVGKRPQGPTGGGGSGSGLGSGTGSGGGGDPVPPPVSIATIKTPARTKGDYGYIDLGRDYPPQARQLGIEGAIRVRLIVDDKGKVKAAVLLNKLGYGLDELALTNARKIEFEPARDTNDQAVASVVVWTFNMTLPK